MAYVLCLIYIAVIYIRPGEINQAWASLHLAEATGVVAAVTAAFSVFLRPRPFANLPNDWCFLGFFCAALLSNPLGGSLSNVSRVFFELTPLAFFYFFIRVTVQTKRQMAGLVFVLCLLTVFQAASGIVQHQTGTGFGGSTAIVIPGQEFPQDGESADQVRIRGTGIYGDPNDLAMSLLIVLPFLFTTALSSESGLFLRLTGLGAIGTIVYAISLTQSRGGFLGLGALCASYVYRRFGRVSALVAVIVIVGVGLASGPSRLQQIDSREGSSQGRVLAWSAGLQMLKSNPVLGVGYGQFAVLHERAAHNSFVDTLGELGLVGGFFFIGMFYWFMVGNGVTRNVAGAASSPLARDLWASVIGLIVCVCFLSREYVPALYVPLAMGATRMTLEQKTDHQTPFQRGWDWIAVLLLVPGVVGAIYVAVRILARYS
jgi:putative inorganic carbon (HCO3(-)) transporter